MSNYDETKERKQGHPGDEGAEQLDNQKGTGETGADDGSDQGGTTQPATGSDLDK